jgi:flavin-binding protein dodecin
MPGHDRIGGAGIRVCFDLSIGAGPTQKNEGNDMAESVYKVIELVGTSTESWEKAAAAAIKRASKTLRDLRVAEVCLLDMAIKDGKVESYRAKIKVSFKYEG